MRTLAHQLHLANPELAVLHALHQGLDLGFIAVLLGFAGVIHVNQALSRGLLYGLAVAALLGFLDFAQLLFRAALFLYIFGFARGLFGALRSFFLG